MKLGPQMKEKFFSEGYSLPTCINPGCIRPVMVRDWKNWSIKSECGTCYKARTTGFFGPAIMLNALDLEHLDGDHFNNVPENVDTICKLCHGKKSVMNNDFSNQKNSARKIVH